MFNIILANLLNSHGQSIVFDNHHYMLVEYIILLYITYLLYIKYTILYNYRNLTYCVSVMVLIINLNNNLDEIFLKMCALFLNCDTLRPHLV